MTQDLQDYASTAINKIIQESLETVYEKGKSEGYVTGHNDGWDLGMIDTKAKSFIQGYAEGHDVGYDRGYDQAKLESDQERGIPFAFQIGKEAPQQFGGLMNSETGMCFMKRETIEAMVKAAKKYGKNKLSSAFEQMRDEHTLMCDIVTKFQEETEQLKQEKVSLKLKYSLLFDQAQQLKLKHSQELEEISDKVKDLKRKFEDLEKERPRRSTRQRSMTPRR